MIKYILEKRPQLVTLLVFIVLAVFIYFFGGDVEEVDVYKKEEIPLIEDNLIAESAIIYDITNDKVVSAKNPNTLYPIASITKLISAIVLHSKLEESDTSVILNEDLYEYSELNLNQEWNSLDLLRYSLITSSNEGIRSLSRTLKEKTGENIVDLMNEYAKQNGLVQTNFINPTGLDAHNSLAGSSSSVFDLSKVISLFYKDAKELALYTTQYEITFSSLNGNKYQAINTNELLKNNEYTILLSKTGFTDIAGGALSMVVEIEGNLYALVVLNSTRTGRFLDMKKLLGSLGGI